MPRVVENDIRAKRCESASLLTSGVFNSIQSCIAQILIMDISSTASSVHTRTREYCMLM